jgi:hypothetical protein
MRANVRITLARKDFKLNRKRARSRVTHTRRKVLLRIAEKNV